MLSKLLLNALIVFLPTQLGRHFWPKEAYLFGLRVDYLSPTFYLQDLLVFALLILNYRYLSDFFEQVFKKRKRLVLFLAVFILVGLNICLALSPLVAFFSWLRLLEFCLLGIIAFGHSPTVLEALQRFLPWLIIFESLLGWAQISSQSSLGGPFWFLGERSFNIFTPGIARASFLGQVFLRPYGTFSHPNSLAGFTLAGLVLFLGKKRFCLFDFLSLVLGLSLILICFSRTVWLAGFLVGLGYLLFRLFSLGWSGRLSSRFLVAVAILPLVVFLFTKTTIEPSSFWRRQALAEHSLKMIKSQGFFGVGAGNFVISLSHQPRHWDWLYWLQPVHNIFLLSLSEQGVLGLGLWLAVFYPLAGLALLARAGKAAQEVAIAGSLISCLAAIIISGFFDHYWLTLVQNQLFLTLALALSFGLISGKINPKVA